MTKKKPTSPELAELSWPDAKYIADTFITKFLWGPGRCMRIEIVGEVRRECQKVHGHIGIVVVPERWNIIDTGSNIDDLINRNTVKCLVANGPRHKTMRFPVRGFKKLGLDTDADVQLELYITSMHDFGRIVAMRTGDSAYVRDVLASAWRRKGYVGTDLGLLPESSCERRGKVWVPRDDGQYVFPAELPTEQSFYELIGLKYLQPKYRNKNEWNKKRSYGTVSSKSEEKTERSGRAGKAEVQRRKVQKICEPGVGDSPLEGRGGKSDADKAKRRRKKATGERK